MQTLHESSTHHDFLQQTMAPGVIVENGRGVGAMLERWRFISLSQPNFEVQVVRLKNSPAGSVVASTKTKVILCESMLRYAFPKLSVSKRGQILAAKLLGQHVEILGHTTFVWDSENGRVLSVDGKADVLTPMLRLLGNLDDLAFVFDQALATLQGRLELRPST
ncbi:BZIP transcription factor [Phytophthora cinnamomi]|uniref:BZIP transcription factor n=1 Tax=Phytophthora cinnamomi TaxID=4785 RepID=UPI003559BD65|nr:BZIP transcription factor [Phytophthora cinnamomi]